MNLVHTMIRVGDLDRSIRFYTELLGMRLFSRKDYPAGEFTLAFIGYGHDESGKEGAVIELTHNWHTAHYDLGNGFGHLAIGTKDVYALCDQLRPRIAQFGGVISREAGPMKGGSSVIAFIKDPDGYAIELVTRAWAND